MTVETPTIRFAELTPVAMRALLADDLEAARAEAGAELGDFFLSDAAKWLWRYRLNQLESDPGSAPWIARAVLAEPDGTVIGYAGYHGSPDESGMVEIGYTVGPQYRRQGFGRAIVAALLDRATAEPDVRTVRASIGPTNTASLATPASASSR